MKHRLSSFLQLQDHPHHNLDLSRIPSSMSRPNLVRLKPESHLLHNHPQHSQDLAHLQHPPDLHSHLNSSHSLEVSLVEAGRSASPTSLVPLPQPHPLPTHLLSTSTTSEDQSSPGVCLEALLSSSHLSNPTKCSTKMLGLTSDPAPLTFKQLQVSIHLSDKLKPMYHLQDQHQSRDQVLHPQSSTFHLKGNPETIFQAFHNQSLEDSDQSRDIFMFLQ